MRRFIYLSHDAALPSSVYSEQGDSGVGGGGAVGGELWTEGLRKTIIILLHKLFTKTILSDNTIY